LGDDRAACAEVNLDVFKTRGDEPDSVADLLAAAITGWADKHGRADKSFPRSLATTEPAT
jgi:hypothetical protein